MKHSKKDTQSNLLFVPLGGCDEIGMNLNLYGYDGKWIAVDMGVTFNDTLGVDILMPDITFLLENKKDLLGLVLTHAHEDHIGAVAHLWDQLRCPIYATPFTAYLLREKLKEAGLHKKAVITEVPLSGHVPLGAFDISYLTLTHSIPEPNALVIRTPEGTILHTGDWKIDPSPFVGETTDEKALKAIGKEGVLALVCDSTNVFVKGRTGSEAQVREKLTRMIRQIKKGRIFVACFASNVARLETAALAAQASNRKAVLFGRSMHRMNQAARDCGYMKNVPAFYDEAVLKTLSPEQSLVICTGSQGENRAALARMAAGAHPTLKFQAGDTVIFSSRIIPGNEEAIRGLQESLIHQGVQVICGEDIEDIHVSGHPSQADLQEMYTWTKPQALIPVHGTPAHLRRHADFAQENGIAHTLVPFNGAVIRLNDTPAILDQVPVGRLALDGKKLLPWRSTPLRDRSKLSEAGALFISLHLDAQGHLHEDPTISHLGIVTEEDADYLMEALQQAIFDALANTPDELRSNHKVIREAVRVSLRRCTQEMLGKKPMTVVHLLH